MQYDGVRKNCFVCVDFMFPSNKKKQGRMK